MRHSAIVPLYRVLSAKYYIERFLALNTNIKLPTLINNTNSSWAQFTIQLPLNCNREKFQSLMREKNIPTAIYYPIPIHSQSPYQNFPISPDNLKNTIKLSNRVISLPMHPYLSFEEVEYIVTHFVDTILENTDRHFDNDVLDIAYFA